MKERLVCSVKSNNWLVDIYSVICFIAQRTQKDMMTHIDIDIQDEQEAARILSLLTREHIPHRVEKKQVISEKERTEARERIMRGGSQTLNVEEMVAYVKETRERKLPFRDDE